MDKTDRRNMLKTLLGAGLAILGAGTVSGCPGGSNWGKEVSAAGAGAKGENVRFKIRSMNLNNVSEIKIDGRDAYIFRELDSKTREEVLIAVDRRCTHKGCKVSFQKKEKLLYCPCHHSKFAITGERLSGPAKLPLKTYQVVIKDDTAEVLVEEESGEG